MRNIICSILVVFSFVVLTSLTDDPPKIPPALQLESPNEPYWWVRFDTTATDTTHRMFVYMGEYGWIALTDSAEIWDKFVPYRNAKDSLITSWPVISTKLVGDTAQINDVFVWQNDTILKDSLAYFDIKPDSVRLRYINGTYSKWYLSRDIIQNKLDGKEDTLSFYEIVISVDDDTDYTVPFVLRSTAHVWFNGSLLKKDDWTGEGTTSITLLCNTRVYDYLKIQN